MKFELRSSNVERFSVFRDGLGLQSQRRPLQKVSRKNWKTSNVQHPTSNAQCRRGGGSLDVGRWMLDVGCFPIVSDFCRGLQPSTQGSASRNPGLSAGIPSGFNEQFGL